MIARTDDILGIPAVQHTVSITIPSTHNYTIGNEKIVRPADSAIRSKVVDLVAKGFSNTFGGATIIEGSGVWVDSTTAELVHEHVTRVESFAGKVTKDDVIALVDTARAIKAIFNQDSVLISIDNNRWFI